MISRRTFFHHATGAASAALAFGCTTRPSAALRSPAPSELCVMTYNLRYASPKSPNSWPERRPLVKSLLEAYKPDLLGTQEGVFHQLLDIASDQPELDWLGLGRDGGSRGEFMAIFYRRSRIELLEYDHFWLSDTPQVIASSTWGNTNRRMVTWGRFRDRRTNSEFYCWNTHLDHALQPAREKAADLILDRISKIGRPELPVLLMGDFNAEANNNPVYSRLVRPEIPTGFSDTWTLAKERANEDLNSFNNFEPSVRKGQRIDWILSRGARNVRRTEVVEFGRNGHWPSDHFPIAAWMTL